MSPLRSVAAIVGGIVVLLVLGVMLPSIVTHTVASLLAGYVVGRIARAQEVRHAIAAAAVMSAAYVAAVVSDNPALPPRSILVTLLAITGPAMVAGAWFRGRARTIQADADAEAQAQATKEKA